MKTRTLLRIVFGILFVLTNYLLPTGVGTFRRIRNIGSVAAIDIFLGWSIIGWAVALAMAVRTKGSTPAGRAELKGGLREEAGCLDAHGRASGRNVDRCAGRRSSAERRCCEVVSELRCAPQKLAVRRRQVKEGGSPAGEDGPLQAARQSGRVPRELQPGRRQGWDGM
jgi:hypothetical protein